MVYELSEFYSTVRWLFIFSCWDSVGNVITRFCKGKVCVNKTIIYKVPNWMIDTNKTTNCVMPKIAN